jgi:hypothetical protein
MYRIVSYLVTVAFLPLLAAAQAPPFLPRQCEADALRSVREGMPDAQVIAISTISISLPLGPVTISVAFSPVDGRSGLWAYSLYSPSKDSTRLVPMTRILTCSDMSSLIPGDVGGGGFDLESTAPIPPGYLQGQALITALETNDTYKAYRRAFPDSVPTVVSLSTAPEAVGLYPAGTPFWVLFFTGETAPENMTCFVHALDGVVECFSAPDYVHEQAVAGTSSTVAVAPNPAYDNAMLTVPQSWTGRRVDVLIIDAAGRQVASFSTIATVPALLLPIQHLSTGTYTVQLSSRNEHARAIMSVIR